MVILFVLMKVLAHELGHNFGMLHDFDEIHGGDNGPCNGQGIMSYGSYDYNQWSTCSRSDWESHYSSRGWGNGCLEDISGRFYISSVTKLFLIYRGETT